MMKKQILLIAAASIFAFTLNAQGVVSNQINSSASTFPECGAHYFMEKVEQEEASFMELSDQLLKQVNNIIKQQKQSKSSATILTIPVVFHVVYNNSQENIPDSVIFNQLQILNESFRRQNADTANTRVDFKPLVGDSKIEFKLADFDPAGNPTNGISRTNTSITHFGGVLPYGPGQNQQITQWVNDSLYYNYFRLTSDSLGGKDPWNTNEYLNVWMGDLRIFEPQFNNFEELVFFALATPPLNHVNWPASVLNSIAPYEQGVLIHYVNVGSNNPNQLPAPYQSFNGVVTDGKVMVHEVGHYLGLRHIWGDGNCSEDDFIQDTPRSDASSNWACNFNTNSCLDTINNLDLNNMVENYMDYSSGACQNSFTKGQVNLMRSVLRVYRPNLYDTLLTSVPEKQALALNQVKVFPNPTNGNFTIDLSPFKGSVYLGVRNNTGQLIHEAHYLNQKKVNLNLDVPSGVYFLQLSQAHGERISAKMIVR
ncbi:MAG: M43 family zinc metalloprotease [Vicingaceae bacterium]